MNVTTVLRMAIFSAIAHGLSATELNPIHIFCSANAEILRSRLYASLIIEENLPCCRVERMIRPML